MGSPVTEGERAQGPTGKNELRHRRRIGRTYAIATPEVTIERFQKFRDSHEFDRTKARKWRPFTDNVTRASTARVQSASFRPMRAQSQLD